MSRCLDREPLQSTQGIEPAFGSDRLVDEFTRSLGLRWAELARRHQQGSRNGQRVLH
jgi:hypothetical protein